MQPDCGLDGVTRRHLAQQRAEHTRQHVTAAALGHTGITGTQHGRVPVRECTDRLRPFAHDGAAVRSGKSGRRLCPAGRIRTRKPGKLPVVRREDDGRAGALEHRHILRDGKTNRSRACDAPKGDAKEARLRYATLGAGTNYTLVEVELLTGRHHQIRAQLSKIGCPIRGDLKYGARRSLPGGGISLHSRRVEFEHPVRREPLSVTAPVPAGDNLWAYFENL